MSAASASSSGSPVAPASKTFLARRQLANAGCGIVTDQQAECLLVLAREAVEVAARYKSRLIFAPGEVKRNIGQLADLIDEIDRTP